MKILKIFGIVAGIHAFALILIFANPGCSSTDKPTAEATAPKAEPAPVISASGVAPAPADAGAVTPAPISSSPDIPVIGAALFSPTRPGTPAATAVAAQPVADVTPASTYVVGKGDSLWSIAKKNHLRVSVLAKVNNLRTGTPLRLGQKLIIPGAALAGTGAEAPAYQPASTGVASQSVAEPAPAGATRHVIRPGETLRSIAHKYKVKYSDLVTANSISDPQNIHPGQELIIPGRHAAPAAAPASEASAPVTLAPAPSANQDLDAGLQPAAAGTVPAIKLDDSSGASSDSKQP